MSMPYRVRLLDVVSTRWRRSPLTQPMTDLRLSTEFRSFYDLFDERQRPELLAQRLFGTDQLALRRPEAAAEPVAGFDGLEVVLFSLPFPANQVVAVVVMDFHTDDLIDQDGLFVRKLLKACAESRVMLGDASVSEVVASLAAQVRADPERSANKAEAARDTDLERHALVFANGERLSDEDGKRIPGVLYGLQWPFRERFTEIKQPAELNREEGTLAVVTRQASFFHGQAADIENSILLSTVQAVGTAARFQRIWRDAYYHVSQFQSTYQEVESGKQTRRQLEKLADEMGNLEFDLAFSVETAADLGLGSSTAHINAFHHDLYEVMQIERRAKTVGRMFERLDSSIRSELTAIESREKKVDDRWRARGAVVVGLVTFLIAPAGLVLAYFGMNTSDIHADDTIFDFRHFQAIYLIGIGAIAAPLVLLLLMQLWSAWRDAAQARRDRRARARRSGPHQRVSTRTLHTGQSPH